MKIEDVRNLAKKANIPDRHIDRFLSEIEVDENGEVKDEIAVMFRVNELAYNIDVVRANLKAAESIREKRQKKADTTE